MAMIWIPGNCIFIGYTNPKIKVMLTAFISVETANTAVHNIW